MCLHRQMKTLVAGLEKLTITNQSDIFPFLDAFTDFGGC